VFAVTSSVRDSVLTRAFDREKRQSPDLSDRQHFNNLAKTLVPPSIQGSPAYYRERLAELLAMVKVHGMPTLFLTLTADEVSGELRWSEINNLESKLDKFHAGLSWNDAPVECAAIFHQRVQAFMKLYIRAG
jgi:hypothetical protein